MENSDRISGDALEARVRYLESRVRGFRIMVAGDAKIEGGFGHLEKSDELSTRISNLEKAFSGFLLRGNGFSASGSMKSGYTLSA